MPKKIKTINPINLYELQYICYPGYAARLELVGGIIYRDSTITITNLATNATLWSYTLDNISIDSDLGAFQSQVNLTHPASTLTPDFIPYMRPTGGAVMTGFRKTWYLDGGATGEKFTISSNGYLTSRILVIEEEHNNATAAIVSYSPTSVPNTATTINFNVKSFGFVNGSTLYWTIVLNVGHPYSHLPAQSNDFQTISGSFTINDNAGSFSVIVQGTTGSELNEFFRVDVRQNSITGEILCTSPTINIAAS